MNPIVYLAVRWPDGSRSLMSFNEWKSHDWVRFPGEGVGLVVPEELNEEQRRQYGVPVRVDAQMEAG